MKNKIRIKWRLVVVALLIVMIFPGSLLVQTSMASDIPMISYKVYYENYGWSNYNTTLKETFECKDNRLEAIMFDNEDDYVAVLCSVYIENDGWTPFVESGEAIGKISRKMPVKSLKLKFDNELSRKFDIMYRVCYDDNTWTKWYSNGEKTGVDYNKDIYNLEIRVVKK